MGRKLSLVERTMVFIITFFAVIYILFALRIWQLDLQAYFIRADKWLELVFLLAVATAISMIMIQLLQWEYRKEARIKRIPGKK